MVSKLLFRKSLHWAWQVGLNSFLVMSFFPCQGISMILSTNYWIFQFQKTLKPNGSYSYLWSHFALFLCNSRYVIWILWRYLVIHQNKWKCVQTRFYVRTMCFYNSPPWRWVKKSRWRTFKNFKIIQVGWLIEISLKK